MEHKTIVDENGFIISLNEQVEGEKVLTLELKENEQIVELYKCNLVKPKWNGKEWIEIATYEEIQLWKEENILESQQTEQQVLNDTLLKTIADIQLELEKQKKLNTQMLSQLERYSINV